MTTSLLENLNLYLQSLTSSTFSTFPKCNYYTEREFQEDYNQLNKQIEKLSVFHINIRSLNANHSKIFQFIAALNFPFDVIILSEIWTYNISLYGNLFQDYNFYYSLPANSSIGGVGAFIHNSFTVTERKDITFAPPSQELAEIIFLEISKLNFQYLIGAPSIRHRKFNLEISRCLSTSRFKYVNIYH